MAAIDRTPYNALVDDDGTNLVGTPWTKAIVAQVLLDPIDVALATKVDQSGGPPPVFSGGITIGTVPITGAGGILAIGGAITTTGPITLANNQYLQSRNAANAADVKLIGLDATDVIQVAPGGQVTHCGPFTATYVRAGIADSTTPLLGDLITNRGGVPGTGAVIFGGAATAHYLYFTGTAFTLTDGLTVQGPIAATSLTVTGGALVLANNQYLWSRNAGNTADVKLIGLDATNTIQIAPGGQESFFSGNVISLGNFKTVPNAVVYWTSNVQLKGVGAGLLNILADVGPGFGVGFDVASDAVLKIRTRAQTNYATVWAGSLALGDTPAGGGTIRLPNAGAIYSRNLANTTDAWVIGMYSDNVIHVGDPAYVTSLRGSQVLANSLTVVNFVAVGTAPTVGDLRLPKNGNGITFTDAAGTGYQFALYTDSANNLLLGDHGSSGGSAVNNLLLRCTGRVWCDHSALAIGATAAAASAVAGDLVVARSASSGAIYFGGNATLGAGAGADLFWDGTTFSFTGSLTPNATGGRSLGTAALRWESAALYSFLAIGDNPAQGGAIRLGNSNGIYSRNAANTADVPLLKFNAANQILLGDPAVNTYAQGLFLPDRLHINQVYMSMAPLAAAAPAASAGIMFFFVRLNAGKQQLMAQFPTGAAVVVAAEL